LLKSGYGKYLCIVMTGDEASKIKITCYLVLRLLKGKPPGSSSRFDRNQYWKLIRIPIPNSHSPCSGCDKGYPKNVARYQAINHRGLPEFIFQIVPS